jgi:hypothetical protein
VRGFDYTPGPTGAKFMLHPGFVRVICGPVGGGKSTVALMELVRMAGAQAPNDLGVRRSRFIILRNTVAQLKSTVKPLIDQWLVEMPAGQVGKWKLTDNIFHMQFRMSDGTSVDSEMWLMAADTPDDVRRLLSVECSAAWVEEAREIDQAVVEGLMGRTNRFPSRAMGGVTRAGVICSTNPPGIGSYWHQVMSAPPESWGIFMQPPAILDDGSINPEAENLEHLAPDYYPNLIEGKTEEWVEVYLKNKFGAGGHGLPVFKRTFRKAFHVAADPLMAVYTSSNPLIVGMDNGLTAAAVIGQQDMRGRINLLDECYVADGDSMGVERFLDTKLVPKLRNEWPAPPERVRFVVDPACFQRSQVNEMTIAGAIEKRGFQVVRASTNDPERRITAVENLLAGQIDGGAKLLASPKCTHIINALEWGYRFKTQADGTLTQTVLKNHHSHIAEALQYLCLHYNLTVDPFRAVRSRPVERVNYLYA